MYLTNYQKRFLLDNFFKNEDYAGWEVIARKLLEKGECVVAGTESIWWGGIGNFIKVETAENLIGCSLYKFDLEDFLNSRWYREVRNNYHNVLLSKKREIDEECEDIANI
jgi:hypothetical protein